MSVPKIIHQLWIGEKQPPINAMNSVKNTNPDFQYMFWCEKTIEDNLDIPNRYKRKIEHHTPIWGKADLYRWFILEKYGGVFVDADMVAIEPIDTFLLNEPFVCYENEKERPGLLATSIQGYPPNHIIPKTAISWVMDNNIRVESTQIESWKLVGPGLLTRTYYDLIDKSVVKLLPSYYFLPDHHTGYKYTGHGKVYMTHEWGSTRNNYDEINAMKIPTHHTYPDKTIDIHLDGKDKEIKEYMKSIKSMEGHFVINIHCNKDITKYIKSMRFVKQMDNVVEEVKEIEGTTIFDTRNEMISHYAKNIDKPVMCELGVFRGEFLDYMETNIEYGEIDGIDLFEGNLYSGDVDGNNPEYVQLERQYILLCDKYRDNPNVNIYKSYTTTYLNHQPDNKYDIIYIDADHSYEGVKADIDMAFDKVKDGGYIMGHDYEMNMDKAETEYQFGTKRAVDEFCEEKNQSIIAKGFDGCVSFCIQVKKI